MEELEQTPNQPMAPLPSIQWFPGHMTKTRRLMEKSLRLVDLVVELTDARIPASSRNPEIDRLVGNKPRVLLLNKCDSADVSAACPADPFGAARAPRRPRDGRTADPHDDCRDSKCGQVLAD